MEPDGAAAGADASRRRSRRLTSEAPRSGSMPIDYLRKILNARVYDVAIETPLDLAARLSSRLQNRVLLKREDEQPVFSYKVRGAYNKMSHLTREQLEKGVITASAGNHAQGVALSATKLGCRAIIVMPVTTPGIKVDAVKRRGGDVLLHGDSFSDAYEHAHALCEARGLTFIHPYDDPDVIAGQGTIGVEICRQHPEPIEAIYVAVGGGGAIAGIASYVKRVRPETKIIGVEPVDSDAMARSLAAGRRVRLDHVGLFADGVAVKEVGEETFRICQELVDEMVLVDTDAICAAIKDVYDDTRSILEPAGALALAGLKAHAQTMGYRDKSLIAIASGANMNFDKLRFVAERAELGEEREAIIAVTIPERPGAFREFLARVGHRNITEFNYRYAGPGQAHIFVGIEVAGPSDTRSILDDLHARNVEAYDLSGNEMEASRPPSGRRTRAAAAGRRRRAALPVRVSRASGRADAIPGQHERDVEHQPVPLSESRIRFGSRAGRDPGAAIGFRSLRRVPRQPGLRLRRGEREHRVSDVPRPLIGLTQHRFR